jgi:hypothetical protein
MIELFKKDEEGIPQLTTEARTLEPFKAIIIADKGSEGDAQARKKLMATKEIAFVYWYSKFDSPFHKFKGSDKTFQIKKALALPEKWKPSDLVMEACAFYEELQKTSSMAHLEAVEDAAAKLASYLRDTDIDERIMEGPKRGELVHNIAQYNAVAEKMPKMLHAIMETKEIVKKEMQEAEANRAGRKTNKWSE